MAASPQKAVDASLFSQASPLPGHATTPPSFPSARRRQTALSGSASSATMDTLSPPEDDVARPPRNGWIAMAFSLIVHGFLLVAMALLVVGSSRSAEESEIILDGNFGAGGGGNTALGEPISLDLSPVMPVSGQATSAMATIDAVAAASIQGNPLGSGTGPSDGGLGGGSGGGFGDGEGDGFLKLPRGAVRKGSFAAFTVPQGLDNNGRRIKERNGVAPKPGESPLSGEVYFIVIRIRMPSDRSFYPINDLSGSVRGTDDYRQVIPKGMFAMTDDKRLVQVPASGKVDVRNRTVDLVMRVPGGAGQVKDTIELKSKLLNEAQTLTLEFVD